MKSESDWVNDMLCEMKDGPVDCIRAGEVTKALEKMKNHKASGVSATVAEMLQATGVGLKVGPGWTTAETRHPLICLVYTACCAGRRIAGDQASSLDYFKRCTGETGVV